MLQLPTYPRNFPLTPFLPYKFETELIFMFLSDKFRVFHSYNFL